VLAVSLLAVALVHLLDLQSKLQETPYLGILYIFLVVACVVAAVGVVTSEHRRWRSLAAGAAAAPLLAYLVSRTVGLPAATDDIGNWLEPLGVAALFSEGMVLLLVAQQLAAHPVLNRNAPPRREDDRLTVGAR